MADGARDYVAIADAYARDAVADKKGQRFGKWVRLAAKRYIHDRSRARRKAAPFRFDPWHANDACDFIEKLPHVEGKWNTPTIVMHPSHIFFVVQLFGFRDAITGLRRFTTAVFAVARKNAKSTLAAAILLYCMCCENEPGAQVITAATTGQQARIVFNVAKRMVEATPDLREAFTLEAFANAIARYDVASSFKPINSKASTQDGLNPSHTGVDEIHAHKTHDLINVLQSAAGARENPLWLFTTTEGYESPGPWPEMRRFLQQLLEGLFEADHFLGVIYAIDEKDKDFDATKWIKANPLMDVNPLLAAEIQKQAIEAKRMPGKVAEFRIKRLNRQSSSARTWLRLAAWQKCAKPVFLKFLEGKPCSAGLDLASTSDLTAFRLTWLVDGVYYTWGRRWVPEDAVAQRTERGSSIYTQWVESKHLIVTPGDVTDYAVIEREIVELCERFKPVEIAFDRWNAIDLCNRLQERGLPMVEFIQGPKSYHPMMQALEVAYIGGKLATGGDPVLQWCAANCVPRYDANMNAAPDKKRSPDKIDDFQALCMSMRGLVAAIPEATSFWEKAA
jgi:phage terminase large subunit-like protein